MDSSGIVAALGKRGKERYVRSTWPNGPKKQEEMEAQQGTEASLCEALAGAISQPTLKTFMFFFEQVDVGIHKLR